MKDKQCEVAPRGNNATKNPKVELNIVKEKDMENQENNADPASKLKELTASIVDCFTFVAKNLKSGPKIFRYAAFFAISVAAFAHVVRRIPHL